VVSGGNELYGNDNFLPDRLYLNDGKGNFSKSTHSLPPIFQNKSCVSINDIDKDGDKDIFVGGLADARAYGIPQTSYLLLNDGKGTFSIANSDMIQLNNLGIVTASAFSDINNDGYDDLIVSGEWMPMTIYINKSGRFEKTEIPHSTGLWQTILVTDVNSDGHKDILAGNWGHNTKLWAGKNGPLKLYVKDFDKNGKIEQVMAYTIDGKEYTFLAKDELERPLPVLKKAYLKYGEVAGKTVQYMFYDLFNDYTELHSEVLGSSCFMNNGKGNFSRQDLPEELQLAPVMAFAPSPVKNTYIAGGNFYGVVPYEGRYDALLPTQFSIDGKSLQHLLPGIEGEIRDIKWINIGEGKKMLALCRNNMGIAFLK